MSLLISPDIHMSFWDKWYCGKADTIKVVVKVVSDDDLPFFLIWPSSQC